jgi:hypothetical protein
MVRFVLASMVVMLLAACGTAAAPPTVSSGIQGTVTVGPTCPVERINSPCPPRPMAATIVIRDQVGKQVAQVRSGADGRFRVNLPPGTYSLNGLAQGNAGLPRPAAVTATVTDGSYVAVNVQFDSGIR